MEATSFRNFLLYFDLFLRYCMVMPYMTSDLHLGNMAESVVGKVFTVILL